jgi:ferredoxin-type protein NapG
LGLAAVNKDRCIAWTGPSTCTVCSSMCPYHAITLDEYGRPQVDRGLCNGCGACENLCPSSRLQSYRGGQTRGIEVSPS